MTHQVTDYSVGGLSGCFIDRAAFAHWSFVAGDVGLLASDCALRAGHRRLDDNVRRQARGLRPTHYRTARMSCDEVKVGGVVRNADNMRRVQAEAVAWLCAIACFRCGACTAYANARAIRSSCQRAR
jgi:hypothetical protein